MVSSPNAVACVLQKYRDSSGDNCIFVKRITRMRAQETFAPLDSFVRAQIPIEKNTGI